MKISEAVRICDPRPVPGELENWLDKHADEVFTHDGLTRREGVPPVRRIRDVGFQYRLRVGSIVYYGCPRALAQFQRQLERKQK